MGAVVVTGAWVVTDVGVVAAHKHHKDHQPIGEV